MKEELSKLFEESKLIQVQQLDDELFKKLPQKSIESITRANFYHFISDKLHDCMRVDLPVVDPSEYTWTIGNDKVNVRCGIFLYTEKEIIELINSIHELYNPTTEEISTQDHD